MTREARGSYRVSSLSLDAINFTLGLLADRIDELEGRRGTPKFKSHVDMGDNKILSLGNAATDTDAINLGGTEDVVSGTASTLNSSLASTSLTLGQRLTLLELKYESPEQTITSAGALQLEHGLGTASIIVQAWLKCISADLNYSVNDEVLVPGWQDSSSTADTYGVSIVPDSTYLNIRFGSRASVFKIADKTTGTGGDIAIAKWKVIFRARP